MKRNNIFSLFLIVAVTAVSVSGCASVRKKFIRQRKGAAPQDEFVPVLQPVEYPKVTETPAVTYQNHYTLAKAFFQDLWDALGSDGAGEKQQEYALRHRVILRIKNVIKEYDKPNGIRRYDTMKSDLRLIEDDVRRKFKPDAVKAALKTGA